MGDPIKRGDIDEGEACWCDILQRVAWVRLRAWKLGLVLERSRGCSSLVAGGKAQEMVTGDDEWTGKVCVLMYRYQPVYRERAIVKGVTSRLLGFKSLLHHSPSA